jgi:hypothetical protein
VGRESRKGERGGKLTLPRTMVGYEMCLSARNPIGPAIVWKTDTWMRRKSKDRFGVGCVTVDPCFVFPAAPFICTTCSELRDFDFDFDVYVPTSPAAPFSVDFAVGSASTSVPPAARVASPFALNSVVTPSTAHNPSRFCAPLRQALNRR